MVLFISLEFSKRDHIARPVRFWATILWQDPTPSSFHPPLGFSTYAATNGRPTAA
ncbi:13888_t:CDS:1, partial [Acaulospora colombiana]